MGYKKCRVVKTTTTMLVEKGHYRMREQAYREVQV